MKRLFLCVLCAVALDAQSISITKPASGDAVSGYAGYQFQVSLASAPSVVRVCYTVDGYAAYNPGIDAPTNLGCSIAPPFSYPYNSYWNLNGSHQLVATAYDSLGNVVAASAAVPFTTANNWPVSYTPGMTVSTGTPVTSNWSGSVNVTPAISGSGSGDNKTFYFYVDGVAQYSTGSITAANFTFAVDTTPFSNGNHNVCVTSTDATGGTTYSDGTYVGAATEWCRTINFQNGTTASEAITGAHDIYLAPGNTFTLTAAIQNTDGSATSGTPVFLSSNTAVASVNQSTGVITAVAKGNAQISAMVPTLTGSNLSPDDASGVYVYGGGPGFTPKMKGWLLRITGGTGFYPGIYTIVSVTTNGVATLNAAASNGTASGGVFSTGPTRQDWAFVWPTNTLPCFGGNGHIYSSYNSSCFVMHEMFSGFPVLTADQPYNPGAAADFNASGINTFELGADWTAPNGTESPSGMSAWQASQNSYVAAQESHVAGYPKLHLYLTGDDFARSGLGLWASTNGPAAQWTTPIFQLAMQSWGGQGNVIGIAMQDEVNSSWASNPLQGPISYGASSQSWLNSITATSGTCTASTTGTIMNAASEFIIHGSSVSGMNSTYPNNYTASARAGTSFTFACSGVANGTYNSSNDPGLVLEPYAAAVINGSWGSTNTSTGFITYNAFAQLRTQGLASGASFGMAWPNAGLTNCSSVANWGGNGTQSIGSITQVGDYSDMYPANGTSTYLVSRLGANTLVNAVFNLGVTLRGMYGCFNPSLPITALTDGTVIGSGNGGYGIGPGRSVGVASTSGNTITFNAPHGITNIIAGMTRLYVTGATDGGSAADSTNADFYLLGCPTPTTCTVDMAATDFTSSATGVEYGVTFEDGTYYQGADGPWTISATGANTCGNVSAPVAVLGSICFGGEFSFYSPAFAGSSTVSRKRGQTFTISLLTASATPTSACLIPADCTWARTFELSPENLNFSPLTNLFYREIPVLSATGGTATIIQDNNYVKGRNASVDLNDLNPAWAFGEGVECMILRCSGERIYKAAPYVSGYSDQQGFTGGFVNEQSIVFADTTISTGGQLFMNQHFENDSTVPVFRAHNSAALIWNRLARYWLQPRLNSPDYGFLIDCGAAAGTYGDVLGCLNASDGPQTVTFSLSAYEASGQGIIRYLVNDHSITLTTLTPGTATDTPTLQPLDAVFYVFPVTFAEELQQPQISARLAHVSNATKIVVRYSYDPYYLDAPTSNVYDCGTGACTLPWDRNIGTVYYRIVYLGSGAQVLATSDVQTF
jgi:hypothetical protein